MAAVEILQVIPELDPGGAELILLSLCRLLPRERFRVTVAALDGRGALAERIRTLGCEVEDLGVRSFWSPAARRLQEVILRRRPALVHSHLFRAHLALAAAARHVPGLVTVATEHQADPRGWALWLLRRATRRASAVTTVSDGVRRHLIAHGFPADRVRTVANGINVEEIDMAAPAARRELGLPEGARVAAFVGRLTQQKGLDILLAAMRQLVAVRPELHLLVAGRGRSEKINEPRLADRVHFLGWRNNVPALLKAADLVVLPSRWEGLSLVLLEAMAARRAVVATRVEGQGEVIEDGVSGLLVPPEDPAALGAAMERILADAALGRHLGEAARRTVEQSYTDRKMAARYAALYDELLL
jgi:starch synthase (maltosyl-transferring)